MQLSKRLQAVISLIAPCDTLADVGCDHGYISISSVQQKIAKRAIAMDINEGPSKRAASHIQEYELEAYIETRLCDGVQGLTPGEADAIVVAGMGGPLMEKIIRDGKAVFEKVTCMVFQPQSEIGEFRCFLAENGYKITKEEMVFEDGKFYPMMQVEHGTMNFSNEIEAQYGPYLLTNRHPVLLQYLNQSYANDEVILQRLYEGGRDDEDERVLEIKKEMQNIESARNYYDSKTNY